MRTISNDRSVLKAASALSLLAAGQSALAGGTIEFDPKFQDFASRPACEEALKRRHAAALSRIAVMASGEIEPREVHALGRDKDDNLTFSEELDLTVSTSKVTIHGSRIESFTCRGSRLEHRIGPEEAPDP